MITLLRDGKKERISLEDFELLVQEFAERIKDIVFMQAAEHARDALTRLEYVKCDDDIEVSYTVTFLVGDILQILGRKRRGDQK